MRIPWRRCSTRQTAPQETGNWSGISVTATLQAIFPQSTQWAIAFMPTRYNAVGKVSNIEVYIFRLARLFHSLHSRRQSPWKSRGLYRNAPQLYRITDAYGHYANVNISVGVFNKPQLHNIRCRVQTRTARAIFGAVKPTQALTTLRPDGYFLSQFEIPQKQKRD